MIEPSPVQPIFDLIDAIVELYLATVIKPFLGFHDVAYAALNRNLRALLDAKKPPTWFTANFITYLRTVFVIPCLVTLSLGWCLIPSIIVILVDIGDFLDGVVARYWVSVRKEKKQEAAPIVGKDKPSLVPSWNSEQRNSSYGGFLDAVCDKVFVVPCWIALLSTIPETRFRVAQYIVLWCLILAESASGTVRFRAYFSCQGAPAPNVVGLDFSSSAVKADGVGKAKQSLEMFGTAFFILPGIRYVGLVLLAAAVPLAYESVRRKIKKRVMYVHNPVGAENGLDHAELRFFMQARGLGSRLVVGKMSTAMASTSGKDGVANARAVSAVDDVIVFPPGRVLPKADVAFLDEWGLDFLVCTPQEVPSVIEDVVKAGRCLVIGEDNTARPAGSKDAAKKDD
uniref:Uncharacterized protein n=1 Tax=Trieres chinensis TaxID=1514140 RepID=A0A7S2EGM5_TRICV